MQPHQLGGTVGAGALASLGALGQFRTYGDLVRSKSRTPPQEGAASHYPKRTDEYGRREATVGEPNQSARSKVPTR